jgi:hypothetical protein
LVKYKKKEKRKKKKIEGARYTRLKIKDERLK